MLFRSFCNQFVEDSEKSVPGCYQPRMTVNSGQTLENQKADRNKDSKTGVRGLLLNEDSCGIWTGGCAGTGNLSTFGRYPETVQENSVIRAIH